jgi:uncharacterized protein (TIGR02117 family)
MRGATTTLAWLHCLILLASCAPLAPLPPSSRGPSIDVVHVVSSGWHAAIVVRRADLVETGLVPEAGDFPSATFIEFGWGDRTYYPAREPTLGMTLGAALRPTPAVMYMAGYTRPPEGVYGGADTVSVAMPRQAFQNMVRSLAGYFDREEGERSDIFALGPQPNSNFYRAHGRFHLFNNCNTWTARVLRAGGVNLSPAGVITAGQLMSSLRATLALDQPSGTGR